MTPAVRFARRLLWLPVKEIEQRDAAVAAEVDKFKAEVRKTHMITGWVEHTRRLREIGEELLRKLENDDLQ